MEQTIPAIIVATAITIGGMVVANAAGRSVDSLGWSWRESTRIMEERLGTRLSIVSSQLSADGTTVTLTVENQGSTVIAEPRLMDVIVSYTDQSAARWAKWLPFADGPATDNTWAITGITGDRRNPALLDPGESMLVDVKLNPPASLAVLDRWLVLTTSTGTSYTIYF